MNKITWKEEIGPFGYLSIEGYVGKWKIFSISYNGIDRDKSKRQILFCTLPGIKNRFDFPDEESAKEKAEKIIIYWLAELIKPNEAENEKD